MTKLNAPWKVTDNSWETSTVYDTDGNVVCECPISYEVTEETQDHFEAIKEANARAIAALPVLIEAAQRVDQQLQDGGVTELAHTRLAEALSQAIGGQSDRCHAISEQGENPGSASLPTYQSDRIHESDLHDTAMHFYPEDAADFYTRHGLDCNARYLFSCGFRYGYRLGFPLCEDCPPVDYPTDKTRCEVCPRRSLEEPKQNEGDAASPQSEEGGE